MQKELKWLENGLIYEIYPQSFLDTNGDGIGDLGGIIEKLDYIKDLGCNIIWINACSESAFGDGGYDVIDYFNVAKRYGNNEQMKELFAKAHEKGIRIFLDFVPGHTSDQHQWFKEFEDGEDNSFDHRFIWIPEEYDVSKETDHVVPLKGKRKGHYVANFYDFQPALNYGYANPDPNKPWQLPLESAQVQSLIKEMTDVMRFWFDLGADGLRVDMAASLVKNDPDSSAVSKIWRELRAMMDKDYPHAAILAEWSDPKVAINAGFHMDFMIHAVNNAYNSLFRNEPGRNVNPGEEGAHSFFDKEGKGNIREFLDLYLDHLENSEGKGFICIPTGNHDIPRLCFGRTVEELRVCYTFLMMMPGVPVIYYGDEIGMSHQLGLPNIEGGKLGEEEFTNRCGARTPMHWNAGKNAGFSEGSEESMYLPISAEYTTVNVETEQQDKDSLYWFVKELTALRNSEPALQGTGKFRAVYAEEGKYPFVFERKLGDDRFWIIVNPADRQETVVIPENIKATAVIAKDVTLETAEGGCKLSCGSISYGIFRVEEV